MSGISTDGDGFTFLRIDDESRVSLPRTIGVVRLTPRFALGIQVHTLLALGFYRDILAVKDDCSRGDFSYSRDVRRQVI